MYVDFESCFYDYYEDHSRPLCKKSCPDLIFCLIALPPLYYTHSVAFMCKNLEIASQLARDQS